MCTVFGIGAGAGGILKFPSKYAVATLSGLPWLLNWLNRNKLLVLAYHGIYEGPKYPGAMPDTFVHVSDMEDQLKAIKDKYRIIEPEQLFDSIETGKRLPPHSALITFDDGYESFFRLAFPVLKSLGIKPIVFVATEYVENQRPFYYDLAWVFVHKCAQAKVKSSIAAFGISEDEIEAKGPLKTILVKMKKMRPEPRNELAREMESVVRSDLSDAKTILDLFRAMNREQLKEVAAQGVQLGGHTHTHTILINLSEVEVMKEIAENKRITEEIQDKPCRSFAYPNGGRRDYSNEHKRTLAETGFKTAFSLTQQRSLVHTDPLGVSRINVATEDNVESLMVRCTGIAPLADRIQDMLKINSR